jgi:hypothetical protein
LQKENEQGHPGGATGIRAQDKAQWLVTGRSHSSFQL